MRFKFVWSIAWKLDDSFAADLWALASWQGALRDGLHRFGARTVDAYAHRPRFELYDLQGDSDEVANLADEPAYAGLVAEFYVKIRQFREDMADPWLHKWVDE